MDGVVAFPLAPTTPLSFACSMPFRWVWEGCRGGGVVKGRVVVVVVVVVVIGGGERGEGLSTVVGGSVGRVGEGENREAWERLFAPA